MYRKCYRHERTLCFVRVTSVWCVMDGVRSVRGIAESAVVVNVLAENCERVENLGSWSDVVSNKLLYLFLLRVVFKLWKAFGKGGVMNFLRLLIRVCKLIFNLRSLKNDVSSRRRNRVK